VARVAVLEPQISLERIPLMEQLIGLDQFIDAWRMAFANAQERLDPLTTAYREFAGELRYCRGIDATLRSYAIAEVARRRQLPFPDVDRPQITPALGSFLIAAHNLLWLARHWRSVAAERSEEELPNVVSQFVMTPLRAVAGAEALGVGDLLTITELARWVAEVLSENRGRSAIIPFALSSADHTLAANALTGASGDKSMDWQSRADAWLRAAVEAFRPEFEANGFHLPEIRARAEKPPRHSRLSLRRALGATRGSLSDPSAVEVLVDPNLNSAIDVLQVLKHELVHATLVASHPHHQHGPEFMRTAAAVGMLPKPATPWTGPGRADAAAIAERLGPFPAPPRPDAAQSDLETWRAQMGRRIRRLIKREARRGAADRRELSWRPLPDPITSALFALRTLSPIARLEGALNGTPTFEEWDSRWPGLHALVSSSQAAGTRQELASRLGLRLGGPNLADDRLAAILDVLTNFDRRPDLLNREHWYEFVATLLEAALATIAAGTHDSYAVTPLLWRRWAQEPGGRRSLAFWTGRLSRLAEDMAADREAHEHPALVWRWLRIARATLIPWLDPGGYSTLCLGHWLEGLLESHSAAPAFKIGSRVARVSLVDIVAIWSRSLQAERDIRLDQPTADAAYEAREKSKQRLGALPLVKQLIAKAEATTGPHKVVERVDVASAKLADLVRYSVPSQTDPRPPAPEAAPFMQSVSYELRYELKR
jgi:hypothetical protein